MLGRASPAVRQAFKQPGKIVWHSAQILERGVKEQKERKTKHTLVPLLQLLLIKVCRLLQLDQLLLRELGLSIVVVRIY